MQACALFLCSIAILGMSTAKPLLDPDYKVMQSCFEVAAVNLAHELVKLSSCLVNQQHYQCCSKHTGAWTGSQHAHVHCSVPYSSPCEGLLHLRPEMGDNAVK